MRLIRGFQREFCTVDWRICILTGLLSWILCAGILWLAGGEVVYRQLCLDSQGGRAWGWIFFRQGLSICLGLSLGIYMGRSCNCAARGRYKGILWWIIGYIAWLVGVFLFLGGQFEIPCLLFLAVSILALGIALEWLARDCLLAAILLSVGILWMMGSFGQTIRIILWN